MSAGVGVGVGGPSPPPPSNNGFAGLEFGPGSTYTQTVGRSFVDSARISDGDCFARRGHGKARSLHRPIVVMFAPDAAVAEARESKTKGGRKGQEEDWTVQ